MKVPAPRLEEIVTGRTHAHVVPWGGSKLFIHSGVTSALAELERRAAGAGFSLSVVSGFRDFESQLRIWNLKARGQRQLLDARGQPLEFAKLSPQQIVFAILRWSALPGGSRHHWGTDLDVIDARTVPPGYQVQLTPAEVEPGGIFGPLHDWLDENMDELGFFRPYREDLGGVSPERWHLSFAPLAESYLEALTLELLESVIEAADMELKDVVLDELETIYDRYVNGISPP